MNTTMFSLPFSFNSTNMSNTTSSLFSAYASLAAFIMLARSMADQLIPHHLRSYLQTLFFSYFHNPKSSDLTLIVDQLSGMTTNQVYEAAEVYLQTKISPLNNCLRVSKTLRQNTITLTIDKNEEIIDTFDNVELKWHYTCTENKNDNNSTPESDYNGVSSTSGEKHQSFRLTFPKKHKTLVTEKYLPYMLARAKAINEEVRVLQLQSHRSSSIDLEHPSTFDTLAMEPEVKRMIINDLDRFLKRKDFYKKVGKAWKRGYLLYGPPGTGKSSLIAAIANYLKFDVYDLELSSMHNDSQLKDTLLYTSNRSILVVEDIDCTVETEDRDAENSNRHRERSNNTFSLSGLLNFIDGLWSSVGDERIVIFTTNHKDRLDPALLRPGRMDVHIHMSYCTPGGFRILASNYLGIHESNPHKLCGEIEGLIESTNVTPAEVAEELMKSDDADVALGGLVDFLIRKKETEELESNLKKDEGTDREG